MAVDPDLLDRAGDLKRALVRFTQEQFKDELAAWLREHSARPGAGDGRWVNLTDAFILQHRLPDGQTALDHFLRTDADLVPADRSLVESWKEVVEGVFRVDEDEGDAVRVFNLIDELSYRIHSNLGRKALDPLRLGTFARARIVPLGEEWLISGSMAVYPPNLREEAYEIAAEFARARPSLLFRNPEKLREAWEHQRKDRTAYIQFFGSDTIVLPGGEVDERLRSFYHFKVFDWREDGGPTIAERAERDRGETPRLPRMQFAHDLADADTVGVIYDESEGLNFYRDYGMLQEAFIRPGLAAEDPYRELLEGYVQDPGVSSLPLQRLAARYPAHADLVIRNAFPGQPAFSWERDAENFLGQYRDPTSHRQHLPSITPLSGELARALAASRARQAQQPGTGSTRRAPGRNDQCPCGSGKKYKRCCGRRG